jgi:signal transduction histidine kinase
MCEMYRHLRRTLGDHPLWVDTTLALVIAAFLALVSVGGALRQGQAWSSMVLPALLSAVVALPLAQRRRRPCAALAGTLVLTLLGYGLTSPTPPVMLPTAIALYTVGTSGDRRRTLLSTAAAIVAVTIIRVLLSRGDALGGELVRDFAWVIGATAIGFAIANRRAYVDEFRRRAVEAERTREEEAQRRVNDERLRIARDVHDGVAHALASISLQASAAAAVIDTDPDGAREALSQIRGSSVAALAELRATLGVLRQPTPSVGSDTCPTLTLEQLAGLAGVLRAGGIEVSVTREGSTQEVPTEVSNVAYRILQEALTNVLRHSGARHADVSVTYDGTSVTLTVSDDGAGARSATATATGYGITGMRERAEAVGGVLEAVPRPEGGFLVRAQLPLAGTA